ncbi:MAG: PIN/TRAM domain-containing protein [Elusimicrobiota bacterium]
MIIWIFRALAILGTPVVCYFQISQSLRGLLLGLFIGLLIVGAEYVLENTKLSTLIVGIMGAAVGIIVAKLFDYTVYQIDNDSLSAIWSRFNFILKYVLALLGMVIGIKKMSEFDDLDTDISQLSRKMGRTIKVLDLSCVIDGRILDICETGFISGSLIVPRFILDHLHKLTESRDPMEKAKGRRGLDILARLQETKALPFKIIDRDIKEILDISARTVRVAKELKCSIITVDFNINKLGALENVPVLNVNDLSIALKPVVLPGEDMQIFIMKEGKEKSQGVGYLDDGTMVVIEDGRDSIGKKMEVVVQSILQTSQGRIIFTKVKKNNGK